jgi:hypothetical protein
LEGDCHIGVDIGRFYGRKEGKQMTEWLTTGQMIDRLKVGEVAESENGLFQLAKSDMGGIGESEKPGDNIVLNGVYMNQKWHILPKYVSFEEAMKALKEGQTVYCHPNWCNGLKRKIEPLEAKENAIEFLLIKGESLLQIVFESEWTIEEGIQ